MLKNKKGTSVDDIHGTMVLQELLAIIQNSSFDLQRVTEAYRIAKDAHAQQRRKSGEPYISHPVEVASIVYISGGNEDMLCSALLHDVFEDSDISFEEMSQKMGLRIARIVQLLSKAEKYKTGYLNTEANLKIIVREFSAYPEALVVKMADRVHNLKTTQYLPLYKQKECILETERLFFPLCGEICRKNLSDRYSCILRDLLAQLVFEVDEYKKSHAKNKIEKFLFFKRRKDCSLGIMNSYFTKKTKDEFPINKKKSSQKT